MSYQIHSVDRIVFSLFRENRNLYPKRRFTSLGFWNILIIVKIIFSVGFNLRKLSDNLVYIQLAFE